MLPVPRKKLSNGPLVKLVSKSDQIRYDCAGKPAMAGKISKKITPHFCAGK
jgi:hypothetical protein